MKWQRFIARKNFVLKWIIIAIIFGGLLYIAYDYLDIFGQKTVIIEPGKINPATNGAQVSGAVRLGKHQIEYDEIFTDDSDGNGTRDRRSYYKNGLLVLAAWDTDKDGKNDLWLRFKEGEFIDLEAYDSNNDGSLDKIVRVDKNEEISGLYEREKKIFNLDKWYGINSLIYTVLFFLAIFILTRVIRGVKRA